MYTCSFIDTAFTIHAYVCDNPWRFSARLYLQPSTIWIAALAEMIGGVVVNERDVSTYF